MGSTEQASVSVYAVLYKLHRQEWRVCGHGWCEMHLLVDLDNQSKRLVAWTSDGHEVVLNALVLPSCRYVQKTNDFHKFVDADSNIFGFGFYPSRASLRQAESFMEAMRKAIGEGNEVPQRRNSLPSLTPHQHSTERLMSKKPGGTLGKLEIVAARAGRTVAAQQPSGVSISDPVHVQRHHHVSYDPVTNQYHGLPHEWLSELYRQFGVEPHQVDGVKLDRYPSRIPRVLAVLKQHLIDGGGIDSVGVFRLAPNASECDAAKQQLQSGTFQGCEDINVIANLIKVYFRELPTAVLSSVLPGDIEACEMEQTVVNVVGKLPEPSQSLFLWLLDMCTEITANAELNKMNAQNLAIVLAPNLFRASDMNLEPMDSLMYSQRVALFVQKAIELRAQANL